ncbi:hypothetical protein KIPE111705_30860 [Kibdelosporangium persicum]|nr:hypothetical protein [Kibdelosporangium persicum]
MRLPENPYMTNEGPPLTLPERSALLALMTFVGEASNTEIKDRYRFTIDKGTRERLKELDLITVHQARQLRNAYVHTLTEEGWRRCREELDAEPSGRVDKGYRLLYGVLRLLGEHLTRWDLKLADLFNEKPQPDSVETRGYADSDIDEEIRSAYRVLAAQPRAWVSLTRLREKLAHLSRGELDAGLVRLNMNPQAQLIPEENQKVLTVADQAAAIRLGGEDKHVLSIDVT